MKVYVTKQQTFTPIKLEINIETEKEFGVLKDMLQMNHSVPEVVYCYPDNTKKGVLSDLMCTIFTELVRAGK